MVDPVTVVTVGGTAAYIFKPQIDKILGPTADYLGEKVQGIVKQRFENVNNILIKTEKKIGDKINEQGSISPRIVERLINSGSFIEDDLTQEYFAGVMATSRTANGKDDRGLYFLDLIGKLSHFDLKIHYILYSQLRIKHLGTKSSIFIVDHRPYLFNCITVDAFFSAFQKYYQDTYDRELILTETASRLLKEKLVNDLLYGPEEFIQGRVKSLYGDKFLTATAHEQLIRIGVIGFQGFSCGGQQLWYTPSPLGAQLFLWAHGEGQRLANDIFNPDLIFNSSNISKN